VVRDLGAHAHTVVTSRRVPFRASAPRAPCLALASLLLVSLSAAARVLFVCRCRCRRAAASLHRPNGGVSLGACRVGDCLLYSNSLGKLNYYVGGEVITLGHLDR
jgi:hypothetical protein